MTDELRMSEWEADLRRCPYPPGSKIAFALAEIDRLRAELAEANSRAERLLAENAQLKKDRFTLLHPDNRAQVDKTHAACERKDGA